MHSILPLSRLLGRVAVALSAFLLVIILNSAALACVNPPYYDNIGYLYAWYPNAAISVNIDPSFSSTLQTVIHDGFTSWQNQSGGIWGVTFTFTYSSTPITGNNTYQVTKTTPDCPGGSGTCVASTGGGIDGYRRIRGLTKIDPQVTNSTTMRTAALHEIGHTFGLDDCFSCQITDTIMASISGYNDTSGLQSLTSCDVFIVDTLYLDPECANAVMPDIYGCPYLYSFDPQGSPYCCPDGHCGSAPNYSQFTSTGCATGFVDHGGMCERSYSFQSSCADPAGYAPPPDCSCPDGYNPSPIIVDTDGRGFLLTNADNGVSFDMMATGAPLQIAWTASSSTNGFLALDRNSNGIIDDGTELFGNFAPQPEVPGPNGFKALAEYDKAENGGNADGVIDRSDAIFSQLRLWQDANHNGVSESGELHTLEELGLKSVDLAYGESRRTDEFGNRFRYRSKVKDKHGAQLGRWAWDVFLVTSH